MNRRGFIMSVIGSVPIGLFSFGDGDRSKALPGFKFSDLVCVDGFDGRLIGLSDLTNYVVTGGSFDFPDPLGSIYQYIVTYTLDMGSSFNCCQITIRELKNGSDLIVFRESFFAVLDSVGKLPWKRYCANALLPYRLVI